MKVQKLRWGAEKKKRHNIASSLLHHCSHTTDILDAAVASAEWYSSCSQIFPFLEDCPSCNSNHKCPHNWNPLFLQEISPRLTRGYTRMSLLFFHPQLRTFGTTKSRMNSLAQSNTFVNKPWQNHLLRSFLKLLGPSTQICLSRKWQGCHVKTCTF